MGKTSLATNIALNAAMAYRLEGDDGKTNRAVLDGSSVGFFSLEMAAEQIATRILAEASNVAADAMRRGVMSDHDFVKLVPAAQKLEQIPFYIDDTPALTIAALRTRARRLKRRHGLGLVVVDYLQLMRPAARHDSRVLRRSTCFRAADRASSHSRSDTHWIPADPGGALGHRRIPRHSYGDRPGRGPSGALTVLLDASGGR